MMPTPEMMIYAPDLFMLVISKTCVIKTSLILPPIGNCDICVKRTERGTASKGGNKHPFLVIALVMRG